MRSVVAQADLEAYNFWRGEPGRLVGMDHAMPTTFSPRPGAHPPKQPTKEVERAYAEATLGPAHPLVAVLDSSQAARVQALTIGAVLAADLIVLLENAALALPLALALACVAVQIVLGLRIAYLASRKRGICRQLIIDGEQQLPLAAIERELQRLGAARHQAALAQRIERLAEAATNPRSRPPFPIYHLSVLRAVAAPLHEIGRLLQSGDAGVRGVAFVESLLASGDSPLYGTEVGPLREELARARYLLAGRPPR